MGAIAALTFADLVPVNHVFVPSAIDPQGIARYYTSNSIMDARESITFSVRPPAKNSQVARVQGKFVTPVMDTVDTTKKIGEMVMNFEFVLPKVSTETQRDNFWFLSSVFAGSAVVRAGCKSVEGVY